MKSRDAEIDGNAWLLALALPLAAFVLEQNVSLLHSALLLDIHFSP
jgi:hypothetical protein